MNFTIPIFWALVRNPVRKRHYHALKQVFRKFVEYFKIADQQLLQHTYLAGDDFSLADVVLGHISYRYFEFDIARAELQHIRAYLERFTQRSQYRTHVMVSYDALRA